MDRLVTRTSRRPPNSCQVYSTTNTAYRYLADFLAAKHGGYALQGHDVALTAREIRTVVSGGDLLLAATQVIHGALPAIAWRVTMGGRAATPMVITVISSDWRQGLICS
jgi:hypothetical protein